MNGISIRSGYQFSWGWIIEVLFVNIENIEFNLVWISRFNHKNGRNRKDGDSIRSRNIQWWWKLFSWKNQSIENLHGVLCINFPTASQASLKCGEQFVHNFKGRRKTARTMTFHIRNYVVSCERRQILFTVCIFCPDSIAGCRFFRLLGTQLRPS